MGRLWFRPKLCRVSNYNYSTHCLCSRSMTKSHLLSPTVARAVVWLDDDWLVGCGLRQVALLELLVCASITAVHDDGPRLDAGGVERREGSRQDASTTPLDWSRIAERVRSAVHTRWAWLGESKATQAQRRQASGT